MRIVYYNTRSLQYSVVIRKVGFFFIFIHTTFYYILELHDSSFHVVFFIIIIFFNRPFKIRVHVFITFSEKKDFIISVEINNPRGKVPIIIILEETLSWRRTRCRRSRIVQFFFFTTLYELIFVFFLYDVVWNCNYP